DSPQTPSRGFLKSGARYLIVPLSGATSWDARGINDLGEIVGSFVGADGRTHGYIATPAALKAGPDEPSVALVSRATTGPGNVADRPASPPSVGPGSAAMPLLPAEARGRGKSGSVGLRKSVVLDPVRGGLQRARTSLIHAANQSCFVQKALSTI